MLQLIIKKLFYGILVLAGVVVIVFFIFQAFADPSRLVAGQTGDKKTMDNIRKELYLDQPKWKQFLLYINDVSPVSIDTKREIEDTISKEDDKFIYVSLRGQVHPVDKKMVAAIIYRDGQYKLFGSVSKTADILLNSIQASYAAATAAGAPTSGQNAIKGATIASSVNTAASKSTKPDTPNSMPGSKSGPDTVISSPPAKLTFEDVAGNVSKDEFKTKSLNKINQFNSYLKILCDKKASAYDQDNAVEQAVKLFVDGAIIETSSVNSDEKKHYKVHSYLDNLKNLHYDRIDITWSKVQYVSDIRLGADGKYYGAVSFEQTFRGYRDGQLVYEDVTKKTAEVELKVYDKNYLGNTISQWDVLLSDIEVMTTKNL